MCSLEVLLKGAKGVSESQDYLNWLKTVKSVSEEWIGQEQAKDGRTTVHCTYSP